MLIPYLSLILVMYSLSSFADLSIRDFEDCKDDVQKVQVCETTVFNLRVNYTDFIDQRDVLKVMNQSLSSQPPTELKHKLELRKSDAIERMAKSKMTILKSLTDLKNEKEKIIQSKNLKVIAKNIEIITFDNDPEIAKHAKDLMNLLRSRAPAHEP